MATTNSNLTVIGPDTKIKGEMEFDKGARILGRFDGRIASKGEVQIGETAVCEADIEADKVVIDGTVRGNLQAGSLLTLNAQAAVHGDIKAGTLVVAEGASFVGQVAVGPAAEKLAGSGSVSEIRAAVTEVKPSTTPAVDLD
ncbi:MAG: polymer-forming cytoskeletal protein, partial [Planctomycetota bacterium]